MLMLLFTSVLNMMNLTLTKSIICPGNDIKLHPVITRYEGWPVYHFTKSFHMFAVCGNPVMPGDGSPGG